MAAFPSILPYPSRDGFSGNPQGTFARTQMESGPARQRQRFTNAPTSLSLQWKFSGSQFLAFIDFFENDIHQGADWFSMKVDIGSGPQTMQCRFVDQASPYSFNRIALDLWHVSASVEAINA